nr:hypothetical protein Q903MT_gene6259 [Picea sitchensis]
MFEPFKPMAEYLDQHLDVEPWPCEKWMSIMLSHPISNPPSHPEKCFKFKYGIATYIMHSLA